MERRIYVAGRYRVGKISSWEDIELGRFGVGKIWSWEDVYLVRYGFGEGIELNNIWN